MASHRNRVWSADDYKGCVLHTTAIPPLTDIDFQVVSKDDWEHQRAFKDGHTTYITAAAWSPNGALLATTSIDRKLVLWDAKTQKALKSYDTSATILKMQWHPTENILSYTNNDGELYIHADFVPEENLPLLRTAPRHPPPLHDSVFGNGALPQRKRRGSASSVLDAILGSDAESGAGSDEDEDGFIVDDDGAGYAEQLNGNGKPASGDLPGGAVKRPRASTSAVWKPKLHAPFQPGSTAWQGNRRYLCLNLVGFAWTVDQETHHTVTVEFYDREFHRDFHFTDPWMYDKACLNEHGALFSCPPHAAGEGGDEEPAHIFYRPHETWTARAEWRTRLPAGESVVALALSERYVVACTSAGYVRVYSLFGVPVRVHRQKAAPAVACAAHGDVVMTVGNGGVGADGKARLVYSLEDVARDVVHQSEDAVALPPGGGALKSVFFSDGGDPCVFDDEGVLLVLAHWRRAGQARWVPLLDASHVKIPGAAPRRAGGCGPSPSPGAVPRHRVAAGGGAAVLPAAAGRRLCLRGAPHRSVRGRGRRGAGRRRRRGHGRRRRRWPAAPRRRPRGLSTRLRAARHPRHAPRRRRRRLLALPVVALGHRGAPRARALRARGRQGAAAARRGRVPRRRGARHEGALELAEA